MGDDDWIERLRNLRRLMGWSQRKLAKELRVTPGAVSQWESGKRAVPGPVKRLVELYEQSLGMVDPPADRGQQKINGSWIFRTLRTSTTAAELAARLAHGTLRSLVVSNARALEIKTATQAAMAEQLADTLGEMKGALMKLGQIASYLDFAAPQSVRDALRTLQDDAVPMAKDAVDAVFLASLKSTPEKIFAHWEPWPFAAASIGQVHRAKLADGTDVAVKVQYPAIQAALESDLKSFAFLDALSQVIFRGQEPGVLREELRERVLEECDYAREAGHQEEFRRIFAADPDVVVPPVFREFSSDRILTTQYSDGARFSSFVRSADQAQKDRAGATIFRVAMVSIFQYGIFNADPHPGNYLFHDGKVVFLDFGCVKRFSHEFLQRWVRYARALVEDRRAEADRLVVEMGFVPDQERFDFDYHAKIMRHFYEPWWSPAPFRFTKQLIERNWQVANVENPNKSRMNMPRDFLFVNRLQWGLQAVLAELEAEANWRAIWDESQRSLRQ